MMLIHVDRVSTNTVNNVNLITFSNCLDGRMLIVIIHMCLSVDQVQTTSNSFKNTVVCVEM